MSNVSTMFAAGIEQVRRSWGWFLVSGIVLMILGIACIGKAQTATTFSMLVLGWVLAISGLFGSSAHSRPGHGEVFSFTC